MGTLVALCFVLSSSRVVCQEIMLQRVMSQITALKKDMIILEKSEFSSLLSDNEVRTFVSRQTRKNPVAWIWRPPQKRKTKQGFNTMIIWNILHNICIISLPGTEDPVVAAESPTGCKRQRPPPLVRDVCRNNCQRIICRQKLYLISCQVCCRRLVFLSEGDLMFFRAGCDEQSSLRHHPGHEPGEEPSKRAGKWIHDR